MVQTEPCVPEAVKRPAAVMLPQEEVQAAAMLAVNCCVAPEAVVVLMGESVNGEVTVAVAVALPVPKAGLAVMVQDPVFNGAV